MKTVYALAIVLAGSSVTLAHMDIKPKVVSGKIHTDGYDDIAAITESGVRVFGFDFAEDADDPFNIQDPGFNTVGASALTPNTDFRFDIAGSLLYWNGLGNVSLNTSPASESLRLFLGMSEVSITGSSGSQSGFRIQTTAANGGLHRHLNAELLGSDGNSLPAGPGSWGAGDGVEASAGTYIVPIVLSLAGGSLSASDPIYLVFNNGLTESQHDEAMEYVQQNILPEPGSVALLGLGGLLLRRRNRIEEIDE